MAPQRGAKKLLRIRIMNASVNFILPVRISSDHWMQASLAEPLISQDSEELRFQESRKPQSTNVFSRILCPALEGSAVSPRKITPPTLPRVRILTGYLSIRPDSPVSSRTGAWFRCDGGMDLPGFKTFMPAQLGSQSNSVAQTLRKAVREMPSIFSRPYSKRP